MSDLISRQKAIEALDFEIVHMMGFSNDEKNIMNPFAQYNKGLEDGIKAIRALPSTEPERKWIPVTERLPMNNSDVIVSILDESGDTSYKYTSVGWRTPDGRYWIVDNEMCCGVIAWMPLPEPYKEVLANQRKRIK